MSRVKVPRSIYLSIEIFHKFLERVPSLDNAASHAATPRAWSASFC